MRGPKVQDQHKLLLKTQIKLQRSISVTGYRESHLRTTCLLRYDDRLCFNTAVLSKKLSNHLGLSRLASNAGYF